MSEQGPVSEEERVQDLAERTYALLATGDVDGARALFGELEALAPQSRDALLVKAALLSADDPDEAMAVVDEVYARWPDDPSVLMARASYLLELYDDPDEALPLVEEAVATLEELVAGAEDGQAFLAEARVMLADCRLSVGDAAGAKSAAEAALQGDASYPVARLALAAAHFALCELDDATREVQRVIELERGLADAHHLLARTAQAKGEADVAEPAFEEAHALAPERFPLPYRVGAARFLELVQEARKELPPLVEEAIAGVDLRIEARPDLGVLREQDEPVPPDVPCLVEVSLLDEGKPEEELSYALDGVVLYQENLELLAGDEEELLEVIGDALVAEIVGALGLDEPPPDGEEPVAEA